MTAVEHKQVSSQESFCSNQKEKNNLDKCKGNKDVASDWRVEKREKEENPL